MGFKQIAVFRINGRGENEEWRLVSLDICWLTNRAHKKQRHSLMKINDFARCLVREITSHRGRSQVLGSSTSRDAHRIMPHGPRRTADYPQDSPLCREHFRIAIRHDPGCGISVALARACVMVVEANWNRFSFSLATLLCRPRSGTSEANRSFKMRRMIDSEFQSHSTPLEERSGLTSCKTDDSVLHHS